jgi:hypothetical protein
VKSLGSPLGWCTRPRRSFWAACILPAGEVDAVVQVLLQHLRSDPLLAGVAGLPPSGRGDAVFPRVPRLVTRADQVSLSSRGCISCKFGAMRIDDIRRGWICDKTLWFVRSAINAPLFRSTVDDPTVTMGLLMCFLMISTMMSIDRSSLSSMNPRIIALASLPALAKLGSGPSPQISVRSDSRRRALPTSTASSLGSPR